MRRGTTSEWNAADPTLNEGEFGYNSTLYQIKIGDGETVWSELDYYQASADITPAEIGAISLSEKGAADGVADLDAFQNVKTKTGVVFEGTTADDFETTLIVTDPTADRTITFPDATGTVALTSDITVSASSTNTFSNKSISLTTNTLSGTLAEFNTALSDADFATIAGTETFTNKTLTSPTINTPSVGTSLTTASTSFDLLNTTAATVNFAGDSTVLSIGSTSGTTTVNNSLIVTGDFTVNGTTTTIDTQTLQVEDKNIVLAYGSTSDVAADGGGITLTGTTNKTFNWVDATDSWTSSEHMNLLTGKSYKINNVVISAALPALTWGEVKDGKSELVIS
jgi:hypothetical protein